MVLSRPLAKPLVPLLAILVVAAGLSITRYQHQAAQKSDELAANGDGPQDSLPAGVDPQTGEPLLANGAGPQGGGPVRAAEQTQAQRQRQAASLVCAAGQNGGSTDVGVTGSSIKVAATIVDDGPGASFLAPVRIGMKAVVNNANRTGICGRTIELLLRNDSWDAGRGQTYLQNFVESEKVFALTVVPSSEGLQAADAYIRRVGVPVVGTDGMLAHQYLNPWIWPVATPTISAMHVMAKEAYDRGARRFGIVFDAKYHFGVEGANAFNQAVKRLTGADVEGYDSSLKNCARLFCGIQPNRPSYTTEAKRFDDECYGHADKRCDFVAYLLEPDTAQTFMKQESRSQDPYFGMGGAQPLFTKSFAEACSYLCRTMRVWTGYYPPIESFAARPEVAKYVNDVRQESATADAANQFLEGGYVGMTLFVNALQKVGPGLTRSALRSTLNSMEFNSGLASPMHWTADSHFANTSAHAFLIVPGGWRSATSMLADPWAGQDIPNEL